MSEHPWYMHAIFYEVSVRAFHDSNGDGHGDLRGLTQKLDYLETLGVDCLWLMPVYPSPLRDDGYDISDFCNVAAAFGSLDDLRDLILAAHGRGIRIVMDLVLNHTSDEHPWFQAARQDRHSEFRDFYVWSDTDAKYSGARIIFMDSERSNWTWDSRAGQYYWHRFYSCQPDLNYDNPRVHDAIMNVVRFWLELGIDGFRVDAVPYLYEREGTNCENLPMTHDFLKRLRALVDAEYPGRILLCEANQWPEDVRPYFGDGDECHMGFHFPLMPRIFMALKKQRADDIVDVLSRTPTLPDGCQWCTFLRNHDELTLEMVTTEERSWMWSAYAPDPQMRLNFGIRRRLSSLLEHDQRRIELANSLLFTLPGTPIIYYGDEIGMGDNLELPDRNGLRTPMQWDSSENAGFTDGEPVIPLVSGAWGPARINVAVQTQESGSLLNCLRRMIGVRKTHPELSLGWLTWLDAGSPSIASYTRVLGKQTLLILANLSGEAATARLAAPLASTYRDLLNKRVIDIGGEIELQPYSFLWLEPAQ